MKINCLSCGHNVDLDDAYAENYEGAIKCFGCNATLEIKTEHSSLHRVNLCPPRKIFERAAGSDRLAEHGGGPEHNSAPLAHADKIQ